MQRLHYFRFLIDFCLATGILIHIGLCIHSNGGFSEFVVAWGHGNHEAILTSYVFAIGISAAPFGILFIARASSNSFVSLALVFVVAVALVAFDLWEYSTSNERKWSVILVPIMFQVPVAFLALLVALALRGAKHES